ncbi:hypothetical protein Tco_1049396 [Tanacetum coccineum]
MFCIRVCGVHITILKTNTPYPSRKIRRICACTHQRPQKNKAQYAVAKDTQYAIFKIWYVNILEDIKRGPYSKKSPIRPEYVVSTSIGYGVSNSLSKTAYSFKQINMTYLLPLDTAYRSSGTETEIFGQFLKELRENTFSSLDNEDANEHIEKVLEIFDLFHVPNITEDQLMLQVFHVSLTGAASRWLRNEPTGSIKTGEDIKTKCVVPKDAKKAIQEMVEYSQKWHNGTSRGRSIKTSGGLAAIQAHLNNLGREIKKVNEKVYAAQVGCEQCKGPYYTKYCPLKEEGKTLEEAYYTQYGGPFQGGGYRATAPGYYQRNNANPSYQE